MKIRAATEKDIPSVLNILNHYKLDSSKPSDSSIGKRGYLVYGVNEKELHENLRDPNVKLMVAEDSEGVKGYVLAYDMERWKSKKPEWVQSVKGNKDRLKLDGSEKTLYVRHVGVIEDAPSKTAIKLEKGLYDYAREEGYSQAVGEICRAPIRNERSEKFHQALGYERVGRARYDGRVWGVWRKDLSKRNRLEEKVAGTTAVVLVLGSLIFFQSNVTGNAIADLSTNTTSWVGGVLLAVGLVAGFFWIKNKKKNTVVKKKKK